MSVCCQDVIVELEEYTPVLSFPPAVEKKEQNIFPQLVSMWNLLKDSDGFAQAAQACKELVRIVRSKKNEAAPPLAMRPYPFEEFVSDPEAAGIFFALLFHLLYKGWRFFDGSRPIVDQFLERRAAEMHETMRPKDPDLYCASFIAFSKTYQELYPMEATSFSLEGLKDAFWAQVRMPEVLIEIFSGLKKDNAGGRKRGREEFKERTALLNEIENMRLAKDVSPQSQDRWRVMMNRLKTC